MTEEQRTAIRNLSGTKEGEVIASFLELQADELEKAIVKDLDLNNQELGEKVKGNYTAAKTLREVARKFKQQVQSIGVKPIM